MEKGMPAWDTRIANQKMLRKLLQEYKSYVLTYYFFCKDTSRLIDCVDVLDTDIETWISLAESRKVVNVC